MREIYVLDTNTLISDPTAWKHFPNSDVIIPIAVINELDKLKKQSNEAGKNARVAVRTLDEISDSGDISTGILLENDILLKIDANYIDCSVAPYLGLGDPSYGDTQIAAATQNIWKANPEHIVTLVSNDLNLKIKAKARGIDAISHKANGNIISDLYSGLQTISNEDAGLELQKAGVIDPRCFSVELLPNEFVQFQTDDGTNICMGRKIDVDKVKIVKKQYPWNLAARNVGQSNLIDLIMDSKLDLVTAIGQAGTGKSIVAIAAAMELVLNRREYDKLIIYKPIQAVGNDIGYLPGTIEEKCAPFFTSIMDSIELLLSANNKKNTDWKRDLEMFQKKGLIELSPITYIRGRSISRAIIILDECQNITSADMKTLLTRSGESSKIILLGDIDQIDNKDLDAMDNGLTHAIEKFKDSELAGHITLTKGERSRLATLASKIL
jgi:PhoH-like ATPase